MASNRLLYCIKMKLIDVTRLVSLIFSNKTPNHDIIEPFLLDTYQIENLCYLFICLILK